MYFEQDNAPTDKFHATDIMLKYFQGHSRKKLQDLLQKKGPEGLSKPPDSTAIVAAGIVLVLS